VLTTKEIVKSASDVELSKLVLCKMDARGRMTIPAAFRSLFDGMNSVQIAGRAHYVEIRLRAFHFALCFADDFKTQNMI
jgi:DNA-binding transcriptional regulator/RsmH inhibitor MraZ